LAVADLEANPLSWRQFRACRSLATLPESALRDVFQAAEEHTFAPGDVLIRQGDQADGLLILLEGTAHAMVRAADGDHLVGRFRGGDVVGEMALVTREPRNADVVADSAARALLLPTAEFDRLAARHLTLAIVLTHLVADRLGHASHDGFSGKTVDGFQILSRAGRGGMAVVYRAREESTGDVVALKMMSYRLIYDPAALERFHHEAALLRDLSHPNIAQLKRLFPAYHTYFLVLEYCDGVNLDRLVKRCGRLTESQVRPILGQIARALECIHQRGIVHRDLKPGNVILTRDGQIKLTDFGIAASTIAPDDGQTRTEQHTLIGTPAFMAPEQITGGPIDARTDVYALACLAHDLLTGRHLFAAASVFDLVHEKAHPRLPPATEIGDGVSAELYGFMQSALHPHPDARPSSAASLVAWAAPCDPAPIDLVGEEEETEE